MVLSLKSNQENWKFYDTIPECMFQEYAAKLGMEYAPELDIKEIWRGADTIAEIGAGYGRIIDGLLERGFKGQIEAIERSPLLCSRLRRKYSTQSKVQIREGSVLEIDVPISDVALWLWSGIIEFPPHEQKKAIGRIGKKVTQLVLETPKRGEEFNCTLSEGNRGILYVPWNQSIKFYLPSSQEIRSYGFAAGFKSFEEMPYSTYKNKKRMLYILQK